MGKTGAGALGTKTNRPKSDSGTLVVKRSSPPIHAGKRSTAKRTGRRAAAFSFRSIPKAFIIAGPQVKAVLPNEIWETAKQRVDVLFRNAGGLMATQIGSPNALPVLNLADGVVECHRDRKAASKSFKANVLNALGKFNRKYPELSTVDTNFRKPDYHSVNVGRSFAVKGIFQSPPFMPELVCVSFGVVSLTAIFPIWNGLLKPRTKTTLQTIGRAPTSEQMGFAITLGNVIAHEIRHQLGLSRNGVGILPVHTSTGVGSDEDDLKNPKIKFTDEQEIGASLAKLQQVQATHLASLL